MTCSPISSLASESLALASSLLLILNNMDTRVLNGLLLVDLKKAFDLVNHISKFLAHDNDFPAF